MVEGKVVFLEENLTSLNEFYTRKGLEPMVLLPHVATRHSSPAVSPNLMDPSSTKLLNKYGQPQGISRLPLFWGKDKKSIQLILPFWKFSIKMD